MGKIVRDATLEAQNALLTQQNNILTQIATNLGVMITSGIMLKGTIGTGGTVTSLPTSHNKGDSYIVITNGTYAGHACSVGDVLSAMDESGTTASDWAYIPNFMANSGAAKYAIENYAGSNLIGTNQTVQNAFSALNSKPTYYDKGTAITSGDDLFTLGVGEYYVASDTTARGILNKPSEVTTQFRAKVYERTATGTKNIELIQGYNRYVTWCNTSGVWQEWQKMPTREEMDEVTNRVVRTYVNGTTGTTFNIPNGYRGMLYTVDSSPDRCGQWFIWATGAGAIGSKNIVSSSVITLENTTNTLVIKSSDGGSPTVVFENFVKNATIGS